VGVVAASAGIVLGVSAAVWYVQSKAALTATANTIYPGHRLSAGGQGNVAWLFDQPASPFVAAAPPKALRGLTVLANGHPMAGNQSEVAPAWLPLPVLLLVVLAVLVTLRRRARTKDGDGTRDGQAGVPEGQAGVPDGDAGVPDGQPLFWTTIAVSAAAVLLLAWSVLPLPGWFGALTLLNRVPGVRTSLALGLVALVLLAIGSTVLREVRWSVPWLAGWGVALAGTCWLMVWATNALPWGTAGQPHLRRLLLLAVLLAAGFTLVAMGRFRVIASVVLIVVAVTTWAVVNPWYRGLGPLVKDPIVRAMEPLAKGATPARVAVYGNATLDALVQSSGVVTLSGLTVYPDADVWRSLAPDQMDAWNNYAKYAWVADGTVNPAHIVSVDTTARTLRINPCAPQTLALHIDWVVSSTALQFSCLTPVDQIQRGATTIYRYRVAAS
jgi:hypothetical protein